MIASFHSGYTANFYNKHSLLPVEKNMKAAKLRGLIKVEEYREICLHESFREKFRKKFEN